MQLGKQIGQKLDLPKEIVWDLPLISMIGQEELTIENHKGLMEYAPDTIRIGTGKASLSIHGEEMTLKQMSSDCIVIQGKIHSLEFCK